jgi:RNA polymerase sigma-70 factor (ECF subfamily)
MLMAAVGVEEQEPAFALRAKFAVERPRILRKATLTKRSEMKSDREARWLMLMSASISGDAESYRRLLEEVSPVIRAAALQACRRYSTFSPDIEDIVQEALLAIHLKRHTWRTGEAVGAWVEAIARNKLIDSLRRRNRRVEIDIDTLPAELPEETSGEIASSRDVSFLLAKLSQRDRQIIHLVSIEGRSMRETGMQLNMSEGATRVALHRALKRLAEQIRRRDSEN